MPVPWRSEFFLILFLDHIYLVDEGKVWTPTNKLNKHYERSAKRTEGNLSMEQELPALNPTRRLISCRVAQKSCQPFSTKYHLPWFWDCISFFFPFSSFGQALILSWLLSHLPRIYWATSEFTAIGKWLGVKRQLLLMRWRHGCKILHWRFSTKGRTLTRNLRVGA